MKKLPLDDRFKKAITIISSCTTHQQLQAAVSYAELFLDNLHRGKDYSYELYEQVLLYQDMLVASIKKQKKKILYSHKVKTKSLVEYHKILYKYL